MEIHFSIYYLESSSPTEHREQERDQEEAQETSVPCTNPGASRPGAAPRRQTQAGVRAGPPWLVCLPFVCSLWNEASPGVLSTQQELFPQSPRAASPWLRPPPALELTGFLKGAWVSLNSSSSSLSEPLPFCMLSRQTSATGMTHQDTEFSGIYLLFNGEEPGAGESPFRGRAKVGRKTEDRSGCSSPGPPPLCSPPTLHPKSE